MIAFEFTQKNSPLVKADRDLSSLTEGYARVKVAGCGLCHTDIGFIYSAVNTKHELPLILGHEISGEVVEGDNVGKQVIIPAVIPCGHCAACRKGMSRICFNQIMPGNDIDGGFAEYIDVPSHELVTIPKQLDSENLARFSVIADAVTTPLQAVKNVGLMPEDVAIIIGCGGVGSFAALIAHAKSAHVIAIDLDDRKLRKLKENGIAHTLNVGSMGIKEVKAWIKDLCKAEGYPLFGHKIFEISGSTQGQEMAFALLNYGARLATVGFTMDKLNIRLSNLMAFDAAIVGNWGASVSIYPEAVQMALDGDLKLDQFTELHPLNQINSIIEEAHGKGLERRAVLMP